MKTTNWKFLALAFAVSTSVFTSCGDDDDPNVDPNPGGEDETSYVLDKDITEDTSLEAGKTYTLSGGIHVVAPATLNIPEGVTIVAKNEAGRLGWRSHLWLCPHEREWWYRKV